MWGDGDIVDVGEMRTSESDLLLALPELSSEANFLIRWENSRQEKSGLVFMS